MISAKPVFGATQIWCAAGCLPGSAPFGRYSMHRGGSQMLDQRAVQSHIEQLQSAANREHRKIGRQRLPSKRISSSSRASSGDSLSLNRPCP